MRDNYGSQYRVRITQTVSADLGNFLLQNPYHADAARLTKEYFDKMRCVMPLDDYLLFCDPQVRNVLMPILEKEPLRLFEYYLKSFGKRNKKSLESAADDLCATFKYVRKDTTLVKLRSPESQVYRNLEYAAHFAYKSGLVSEETYIYLLSKLGVKIKTKANVKAPKPVSSSNKRHKSVLNPENIPKIEPGPDEDSSVVIPPDALISEF